MKVVLVLLLLALFGFASSFAQLSDNGNDKAPNDTPVDAPEGTCTIEMGLQCAGVIVGCAPNCKISLQECLNCIGTSLNGCCPCLKAAFGQNFPC